MTRFLRSVSILLFLMMVSAGCGKPNSTEKIPITLGVGGGSLLDKSVIDLFNAQNEDFHIVIRDYYEEANFDSELAIQRLNAELASGNGPDLLDLSSWGFDLERYAQNGVFEDLYPYLKDDPEISADDLIPEVLACCTYDGRLCCVMSGFGIRTMYIRADLADGKSSWTVDEFLPYLSGIGWASLQTGMLQEHQTPEDILDMLSRTTFSSFVNYSTGTVNFSEPEFIAVLNACRDAYDPENYDIVCRFDSVWDFMEHQVREAAMGSEIVYIGFPTLSGQSSGNYLNNQQNYLAICATSEHKDICWSFLRQYLTVQYQTEAYIKPVADAFPTNLQVLSEMAEYSMQALEVDGVEITQRGQYNHAYAPASQDAVAQIFALIETLDDSQCYDSIPATILSEEIADFLYGTDSAEAAAERIQNRVELYIREIE